MSLTTADVFRDFGEALELCARDLSVGAGDVHISKTDVHYKSTQIYVGLKREPGRITHVIKTQPGRSPQQELDGMLVAQRAFAARDRLGPHRFGAVVPVGCRVAEPSFLVTRYLAGSPVRSTFDAALLRLQPGAQQELALERSRGIASWLVVFRSTGAGEGGGLTPAAYLEFCRARVEEIRVQLRLGRGLEGLERCLERHVESMAAGDRERLGRLYARHGDLAPQNFLLGEAGELVGLDFGTFGFTPLNADYFHFRMRLEHYALRRPWAPSRALALWQAFSDTFTAGEGSNGFAFHGYLHALLGTLALRAGRAPGASLSLSSRLKLRLWVRGRLRWLKQLTGELPSDVQLLRSCL